MKTNGRYGTMKTTAVIVNGQSMPVTNYYSSGPGAPAHEYELGAGRYLFEIAGQWYLQEPGQVKRAVGSVVAVWS